jgi:catechol 2,3-dioxygenase-like lactoylglutathione lyase family enzyme
MMGLWRPILEVPDPEAALDWFAVLPGCAADRAGAEVRCGDLRIAVVAAGTAPAGSRLMTVDHLALRTADVDAALAHLLAAGARLHPGFTPDGPRDIAAFWDHGVRFAFVIGPGGVPVEICARHGDADGGGAAITGLDHLGLRCADVAATAAGLEASGAVTLGRYLLAGPVEVRFLQEANIVWELFDEPVAAPSIRCADGAGWAGVAPG